MNIYVILKTTTGTEAERFDEIQWEETKKRIDKNRILYATPDITDSNFKTNNIEKIIWGRVFNPAGRNFRKVFVKFSKNVSEMEQEFDKNVIQVNSEIDKSLDDIKKLKFEKFQRKTPIYEKELEEHRNKVLEINKLFSGTDDEYALLSEWKKNNFIMPPPDKIKDIKDTYNMSWSEFIEHCKTL